MVRLVPGVEWVEEESNSLHGGQKAQGERGESSTSFKDDLISHRTEESTPSLPKVPQVGNRIFRHKPLETHCSPS